MPNKLSLKDYKKKYANMGTIGKVEEKIQMRKVKIKEALNPYENMESRNRLNNNMSTRELGQRDSLYETDENRGKSA